MLILTKALTKACSLGKPQRKTNVKKDSRQLKKNLVSLCSYMKKEKYIYSHMLPHRKISSDASELLPKPKRRKISSSPMCDTSDIPNFNLCSFSLGSTQGTDSEGNSAAVVVREETQECRQQ
ncbi:uncharacterized protein [Nicotiana sylvestris]|uniref:uncharacterized protein n=1 Tax=Nicotiana sylvestris TaxID=4096 RepID=UPI00388C55FE